jgi:hypothetical protein
VDLEVAAMAGLEPLVAGGVCFGLERLAAGFAAGETWDEWPSASDAAEGAE